MSALPTLTVYIQKKFELNVTKIKGGCQCTVLEDNSRGANLIFLGLEGLDMDSNQCLKTSGGAYNVFQEFCTPGALF